MRLKIKVTPNTKTNQIVGWLADTLKVKIAAPAQKGKANKELIKFLSNEFDISKYEIKIIKGFKYRNKVISINSKEKVKLPAKQKKLI